MNSGDAGSGASTFVAHYQLVYSSTHGGRSFVFPCDAAGTVELNMLSDHARYNYLLARALVGGNFHAPTVRRTPPPAADDDVAPADIADWPARM